MLPRSLALSFSELETLSLKTLSRGAVYGRRRMTKGEEIERQRERQKERKTDHVERIFQRHGLAPLFAPSLSLSLPLNPTPCPSVASCSSLAAIEAAAATIVHS
jgi:hypothetical protein